MNTILKIISVNIFFVVFAFGQKSQINGNILIKKAATSETFFSLDYQRNIHKKWSVALGFSTSISYYLMREPIPINPIIHDDFILYRSFVSIGNQLNFPIKNQQYSFFIFNTNNIGKVKSLELERYWIDNIPYKKIKNSNPFFQVQHIFGMGTQINLKNNIDCVLKSGFILSTDYKSHKLKFINQFGISYRIESKE